MRPVVETTAGRIAGVRESGVSVFRGIPYGASTAGAARFLPPASPDGWVGVRECLTFGDSCPPTLTARDRAYFPKSSLWSVYAGVDPNISFSEDCLRLNVWTRSCAPSAGRAVVVWLHGGGFSWGSGSSPLTAGDQLARNQDVVVVTVNHRLGVFGYLHVPDGGEDWADSGIAGLLDLRLALEWVRDNIASFGGDPANVTIVGHSGGAAKVACLLALPSARGLFQRAVIMSGVVTLRSMTTVESAELTARLLSAIERDGRDLAWIRELSSSELAEFSTGLSFRPVVGEPGFPNHPFDPVATPGADGIPMLVGVAKDDAATFKFESDPGFRSIDEGELERRVGFLPGVEGTSHARRLIESCRSRLPDASPAHVLVDITTQGLWERTATMVERKLAASDAPVWMYEFAYDIVMPPDTAFPGELMSPHGVELPFVFDLADREWLAGDRPDRVEFGHRVSAYWMNFARTGDPNGSGLVPWPRYTTESKEILTLRLA